MKAQIIGTGSYAPKHVLTNHDLEDIVDTSDEWIVSRSGIRERRIAHKSEAASDLAYAAAREAMSMAQVSAKDLDLIIAGTISSDTLMPATACLLQERLGAKTVGAFDLAAACSGFLYGLSVAEAYLLSRKAKRILLVGVDVLSRFTDYHDRNTCVLFGDGAGAAVLSLSHGKRGILSTHLYSNGKDWQSLAIPGGGSRLPATRKTVENSMHVIKMNGKDVFVKAVKSMEESARSALRANHVTHRDIALFIPHQANLRIIQAAAERLSIPLERVFLNLEWYGNTSAASIPLALDEAVRGRKVKAGDLILMSSFGGGFTWASALIRW